MEHAKWRERIPVFFFFFKVNRWEIGSSVILLRENRLRVFLSPPTTLNLFVRTFDVRRFSRKEMPHEVESYWRRTLKWKPLIFIFSYRKAIRTSFRCFCVKQVSFYWIKDLWIYFLKFVDFFIIDNFNFFDYWYEKKKKTNYSQP